MQPIPGLGARPWPLYTRHALARIAGPCRPPPASCKGHNPIRRPGLVLYGDTFQLPQYQLSAQTPPFLADSVLPLATSAALYVNAERKARSQSTCATHMCGTENLNAAVQPDVTQLSDLA